MSLPRLDVIDLLAYPPDADEIDLQSIDFSVEQIPLGVGVYCFYDPRTLEPVYVGAGTSDPLTGIRNRVRGYVTTTGSALKCKEKIRREIRNRRLLLRVWVTASAVDALKYEADTITRHRPELNHALKQDKQAKLTGLAACEYRQEQIEQFQELRTSVALTHLLCSDRPALHERSTVQPDGTHSTIHRKEIKRLVSCTTDEGKLIRQQRRQRIEARNERERHRVAALIRENEEKAARAVAEMQEYMKTIAAEDGMKKEINP